MKINNSFFLKIIVICFFIFPSIKLEAIPKKIKYASAIVTTSDGIEIPVEIADTFEKRSLGLGKRTTLKKNWGMLFIFKKKRPHKFWMKNMKFPLDIIWLDNNRIVYILKNVAPSRIGVSPPILEPIYPANFVLEIAAGRVNELNIKKGDFLNYKF